jgi:hypothetical protein
VDSDAEPLSRARAGGSGGTVEVQDRVSKERGLGPETIRGTSLALEVTGVRTGVAYEAVRILEVPGIEVARYLLANSLKASQMVNRTGKPSEKLKT